MASGTVLSTSRKQQKDEAAGGGSGGAPPSPVLLNCRLICLIFFAVGLFCCCALPALSGDPPCSDDSLGNLFEKSEDERTILDKHSPEVKLTSWLMKKMFSLDDVTKSWRTNKIDVTPIHPELKNPKIHDQEWAFFDFFHPEASQLRVEQLPRPHIRNGVLEFEKTNFSEGQEKMLLQHFAKSSPHSRMHDGSAHILNLHDLMKFLMEELNSEDGIPDAAPLLEKIRGVIAKGRGNSSMMQSAAVVDDNSKLALTIEKNCEGNIELHLSKGPKREPRPGMFRRALARCTGLSCINRAAAITNAKKLIWHYSATFRSDSNGLTPIKDSLSLSEVGDSDKDATVGNWILNERINQSFDATNWKSPKSSYFWNLRCFDKKNSANLKYEFAWHLILKDFYTIKETFVGKVPFYQKGRPRAFSEGSISKPKSRSLIIDREYDPEMPSNDRECFEQNLQMTDGWKLTHYYIGKSYSELNLLTTWSGIAKSKIEQNLSISLDGIPLNYHLHFGIVNGYPHYPYKDPLPNIEDAPEHCVRYACMKVLPATWSAALFFESLKKHVFQRYSYTLQDLKKIEDISDLFNFSKSNPEVLLLKKILTCPVEIARRQREDEPSQLLGNPHDDSDSRSLITNRKSIILTGSFLFCIALILSVFVKQYNLQQKNCRKNRCGIRSTN